MINKIANAWICTIKDNKLAPVFGDLHFGNGIITGIVPKSFNNYLKSIPVKEKFTYDAGARVLTLSNVNFHEHIYSRLAKGLPITGKTDNFYRILDNIWWKLDRSLDHDSTKVSAQLAAIESIKNGVTYIIDHHASPLKVTGSLDVIADVLKDYNLRGVLAHETSDRNGKKYALASIEENLNFLLNSTGSEIKSLFGLHAPFTLDDNTLKRTSEIIKKYDTGIHIHLCEDKTDRLICKKKYGVNPLARLLKYNLLNERSILAHSIYLTKNEYKKIARTKAAIAINIDSNLNNSVGIHNFRIIPNELQVLCGTDGMHANPAKTLKNIFLLMRHTGLSSDEAFGQVIRIYFNQLEFIKRLFPDFSLLNKNDGADFIIRDYAPPTPINKTNFWGHYIYGVLESEVLCTVQRGKFLMKDKKLVGINEDEINKEIYKQGEKLFRKFKKL
jgi:cytosine/adenosine deaminase-related metal-dependent hydrolase